MQDRQSRVEAGMTKGGSGSVVIKSIESEKLDNDIEDTNDRVDDLQRTVIENFEDLRDDLSEALTGYLRINLEEEWEKP